MTKEKGERRKEKVERSEIPTGASGEKGSMGAIVRAENILPQPERKEKS